MAAVNSVQGGLRLPLAGIASPRLLMCSASMGAEGSVTLQLREAVEAPDSSNQIDTTALTIGYSESDIIADMLGSIQAAGDVTNFDILDSRDQDITNAIMNGKPTQPTVVTSAVAAVTVENESVANSSNSKTTNNPNGNNNNNVNINNNNNNNNSRNTTTTTSTNNNNNNKNNNNNNNNNGSQQQLQQQQQQQQQKSINENVISVQQSPVVKKSRPKTSSPTRHGPQQCQVCSKIFGNASALAKHKLTHSDERKYVCGMCSKAFKRQDHLNGHMLTHRNKKPYECKAEGCGKSYCDARSLRRHTENHHSSLAMTPTTPNQSISSTGPLTGLSLSPATASGDASSPHGSNCLQFNGNGTSGDGSKSSSPSLPAGTGNEGLTRQQLDLISQIMQQTKANATFTTTTTANGQRQIQRPRTWNMQTQLQQNQTKLSPNSETLTATLTVPCSSSSSSASSSASSTSPNAAKVEQKPVECNLCHRKFKNIPALNGHMRLHGGYFKKDTEAKKCDKKETTGPPLQTASVGIRALIEEKIISKRGKDLKGSFAVPAPPLLTRRLTDTDNFIAPKTPISINTPLQATIVTSGSNQTATITKMSPSMTTIAANVQLSGNLHKHSSIETKDATLIELLKRGTKVAVKRSSSDLNGSTLTFSPSSTQTTTVLLPTNVSMSSPVTPTSTPPLAISLSGNGIKSTPLALTISQNPNNCGDVYTLAYSTDSTSTFFNEHDVYNVPDTAMLLQAVDSIHLLQNSTSTGQLGNLASIGDYTLTNGNDLNDATLLTRYTPSRQIQAVLNSPLPEGLAEFSALHSKDFVLYGGTSGDSESPTTQSSGSPLPSPLSYPTPPASHEGITQSSPYLDDAHHFGDASSFFDDKKNISFLEENGIFKDSKHSRLSDCEQILKLKHELFNDAKVVMEESLFFKEEDKDVYETKASDLLAENNNHNDNIDEFNQNLSFLDESQNFLEDARNPSSPLSAAFFTGAMSSAEEVKEALQEVLPNESISCEQNTDIDLYYLPSLALQSQMMLNSDDPLLSSSPKDFANKHQIHKFDFNLFSPPSAKKPKLDTTNVDSNNSSNKRTITVKTEPIPTEIFLSPSSLPISVTATTTNATANNQMPKDAQTFIKKRQPAAPAASVRKNITYKSSLRKSTASYFTPSPILNPKRIASGLCTEISRDILEDVIDFDFAETTCVPEFISKSKVNIGSDFQAVIPTECASYGASYGDDNDDDDDDDQQLWNPNILQNERQIQRFVDLAKSTAVPLGCHSEEMALKALQEANGETHKAILTMLQEPPSSIHKRWQQQEVEIFLKGLEVYGKNFYKIANEIPSKTTGDCVQFYYFWKKLCVDYKFTHLNVDHTPIATDVSSSHTLSITTQQDIRPHVCEMPDCSASFTSKAALHGHTRIHCIGRNINALQSNTSNGQLLSGTSIALITKEDFPCKVCGKIFNKVKSRSAHMKSHRAQESETSTN